MDHQGNRILIVDDSPDVCELLGTILSMDGYEIVSAQDGVEALEKLRAGAFDLIISDVLMPRMDGFQLCREVKTDEKLKAIPVVFYTGHFTDPEDEELLRSLGAARYLLKPVKRDQLLENIRQVLNQPEGEKISAPTHVLDEGVFTAAHVSRITLKLTQQISELERERNNLHAIFDAAQVGMLLIDDQGEVTRVNQIATKLVRKDAAEMLHRQPGDGLCCIHAASVDQGCGYAPACPLCPIRNTFSAVLRTGETVRGVEAPMKLVIGGAEKNFYFSISASPLVLNGRNHVLLALSDITDRRQREVLELHSQKLESVGQLAAGIAHEINTPIQFLGDNIHFMQDAFQDILSIISLQAGLQNSTSLELPAVQVLIDQIRKKEKDIDLEYLRQEIPKAIQQSLDGLQRVSKIVQAMREFSHPGGESKTNLDINKAIETTITLTRNEWRYSSDLITDFSPDLPEVLCYPADFNQVILNLLVNASQAVQEKIGNDTQTKGQIKISTRDDGNEVEICIRDTGTGIPPEAQSRVFDPFFTTKEVGKGTGQGLSIARNIIVQKHGGKIYFETEVGTGTAFYIRLPRE